MAAGHHAAADIIHDGRTDLRGRVDRVGVCEGAEERVAFRAVVAGKGAAGGIGIESGGAMTDGHEGVPEFLLARRWYGSFDGGLQRGVGERLNGN